MPTGSKLLDLPEELRAAIREQRNAEELESLRALREIIDDYLSELSRDDDAHQARLYRQQELVWDAVREAHEARANRSRTASAIEIKVATAKLKQSGNL